MPRIPRSTYRMQFHHGFRFSDAEALTGYLAKLGVGDIYASPILTARAGSMHGYDVTDPTTINPELGGEPELAALAATLKRQGMGLLLDIVPNHMASSLENAWWYDVLTHGRESRYASFFDIDWESPVPGLRGKVLLPVLGGHFGDVLEAGDLALEHHEDRYVIRYYDNRFPVAPASLRLIPDRDEPLRALAAANGTAGDPDSFRRLEMLLAAQHYRLAYWRVAAQQINYRRFFDVSDLVSLRVEDELVFDASHRLLLELAKHGDVTGLRIDHIDGLFDPAGYLEHLQASLPAQEPGNGQAARRFYVVVEKILASDESVPDAWLTEGTSGYDFLNVLNGLFVESRAARALQRTYARLRGAEPDFEELVHQRKRQVMTELFPGDIHRLAVDAWRIAAETRDGHDLLLSELEEALIGLIAWFAVYRTYTRSTQVAQVDRERIEAAVADAIAHAPGLARSLQVLRSISTLDTRVLTEDDLQQRALSWVMRWQQFTGPIMAKGYEDTSLYVFNRLVSLNEVGGEPDQVGIPVSDFHPWARIRQERWPGSINTTSTHDTKRSEDVRARINVLSELADEWDAALTRWQTLNLGEKAQVGGLPAPDGNEDHLIYHSLVGAWPFEMSEVPEFRVRMQEYIVKAAREAKTHTSWLDQHAEYEEALTGFLERIIVDDPDDPFLSDFLPFQKTIAFHGALNSLAQTLLKITLPGVPDFYQGTELWDLSLVDPDNRRPVDFEQRARMLDDLLSAVDVDAGELLSDWQSGRVKLLVIARGLALRNRQPELFNAGRYVPLIPEGDAARHVVSFARELGEERVIVATPRLTVGLARIRGQPLGRAPIGDAWWTGLSIPLPEGYPTRWRDVLTGEARTAHVSSAGTTLDAAELFDSLPLALMVPE